MNRFFKKPYIAIIIGIIACGVIFDLTGNAGATTDVAISEETSNEQLHIFLSASQMPTINHGVMDIYSDKVSALFGTEPDDAIENEQETAIEAETEVSEETTLEAETEAAFVPVISYSEEDYNNFLRIVEAEATGGDVKSKMLVANVIINRVKDSYFPNNLTDVIFQKEQFSPIYDGRFYTVTVTDTTIEAVNRALAGEDYSQGATFFCTTYLASKDIWHTRTLKRLFEYGGHVYFAL